MEHNPVRRPHRATPCLLFSFIHPLTLPIHLCSDLLFAWEADVWLRPWARLSAGFLLVSTHSQEIPEKERSWGTPSSALALLWPLVWLQLCLSMTEAPGTLTSAPYPFSLGSHDFLTLLIPVPHHPSLIPFTCQHPCKEPLR